MKFLDIHAHLETSRFEKDLDKVIERCRQKEIIVINAGVNPSTNQKNLELKQKYSDVIKISFGLYPIDALAREIESSEGTILKESGQSQKTIGCLPRETESFNVDEELKWIEKNKNECVAIGEIGLDYNYDEIKNSDELKEKQKKVFRKILQLAKKLDKPVVIHSRKAEADAIEILEQEKMEKVIMHCFSGNKKLIKRCIENGWFFSVPPVITRLEHFKMLVSMTPIEQLLTETDSPYLSPVAGERNEPVNILTTIKEISKIKKLSEEEVRKKILENSIRLFGVLGNYPI